MSSPPLISAASRHRTAQLRGLFAVVPPATHVGQALIFWFLRDQHPGYGWLSGLSVAALGWFAVAIWLLRRGSPLAATWMIWLEVATHSALLHFTFGREANFFVYPVILAAACLALFSGVERGARWSGFALALAAGIFEYGSSFLVAPWIVAEPWVLTSMGTANALTATVSGMSFVTVLMLATEKAETEAEAEAAKGDALLKNVLPARIAEQLKARPGVIADETDEATVLFADIAGFTPMAATRTAAEVVALLDRAFTAFDAIAARHGLEKIKTIGDAYMAVAGVPDPHEDGAGAAAMAALELIEATDKLSEELGVALKLRVGLHTGPVVAGVIGTSRVAFDLWGDTVNTASRMESHGEPGRVHVTAVTAQRLRGRFVLQERGVVSIKGKGELVTFWVVGPVAPMRSPYLPPPGGQP